MARPTISVRKRKEIARERIAILFDKAKQQWPENKGLSNRYVTLARKLAMKAKIRMPREFKRLYCKHCYKYLSYGSNARQRIDRNKIIISCFECKKFTRIPLIKKKIKENSEKKNKNKSN